MTARFVVGLGASAGGLEALEQFFDACPTNSDGAFVVVMHLSRDFKSMLDELLARHTDMPVIAALDGTKLEANTVYVIQRATILEVEGGAFRVTTRPSVDPTGLATTVDTLFHSIARDWKEQGAAVVLSGSGSDGARGAKAVQAAGGFVCAQSPETARFDSMPVSTIGMCAVDAVDAPGPLAKSVIDGVLLPRINVGEPVLSDQGRAFSRILDAIIGESNLDASKYKHSTFERRVRRRMMDLKCESLEEYATLVANDKSEARTLKDTMLIGVTEFFRDQESWDIVERQVVPELIRRAQESNQPIRIWTPGCATGEEAYSMGMMFLNAFEDIPQTIELQIFATDVKRQHLNEAARGEFTAARLKNVPQAYLDKYFDSERSDGKLMATPLLRKRIIFAPHDILSDPPFTRLDMISCRNVLIYFSMEAQQKILSGFAFGLVENGFLFLGGSETVGGMRDSFDFVDARNRVFKRTRPKLSRTPPERPRAREYVPANVSPMRKTTLRAKETALLPAYAMLLKSYAPASLLVSTERQLLHSFGSVRDFLRPPDGLAHLDASDMVDTALKTPMIAGIERVLRERKEITFSKIEVTEFPEPGMIVDLQVKPLLSAEKDSEIESLLILIEETAPRATTSNEPRRVVEVSEIVDDRVDELELELQRTREALQSTIEEIETTNEELQASNEELMSSNEELQSTNEELSSVNEELYSVNSEYHRQNDELAKLNGDFDILLLATEIAVVFVDPELRLSRFTTLAGELFGLQESDIGRPISLFRSPFEDADPAQLFARAKDAGGDYETEALDQNGHAWLLRVIPDTASRGSVLTAISINALRIAEATARKGANFARYLQRETRSFYLEVERQSGRVVEQFGAIEFWGGPSTILPYKPDWNVVHEDDREAFESALATSSKIGRFDGTFRFWNAEMERHLHLETTGYLDRATRPQKWVITAVNVDRSVGEQIATEARSTILQSILRVSPALVAYLDTDERYLFVNQRYGQQWGGDTANIVGMTAQELLPEELYASAHPYIKRALAGERQEFSVVNKSQDKPDQELEVVYDPVLDEDGAVMGFTVSTTDVSGYRERAEARDTSDRAIVDAILRTDIATVLADVETGAVDYANAAALQGMGYGTGPGPMSGMSLTRLAPEWGLKRWKRVLGRAEVGRPELVKDVMIFNSDIDNAMSDLHILVFDIESGRKALIQAVDMSERSEAISDLRERSNQLSISNRDLEQFASAVAHDLRAPLRHVSHFATYLEEEVQGAQHKDAQEYLSHIQSSTGVMSSMIESLLDYSRIGSSPRSFSKTSLSTCIKAAKNLLGEDIAESGAVITTVGRLPQPISERDLLIRLFQNLFSNSIKYVAKGVKPKIKVEAKRENDNIVITVTDNGIGVDPKLSDRIFTIFTRLHSDANYSGLGVGLATCRRICELHNGTISCDPTVKKGSKFIVTLPEFGGVVDSN